MIMSSSPMSIEAMNINAPEAKIRMEECIHCIFKPDIVVFPTVRVREGSYARVRKGAMLSEGISDKEFIQKSAEEFIRNCREESSIILLRDWVHEILTRRIETEDERKLFEEAVASHVVPLNKLRKDMFKDVEPIKEIRSFDLGRAIQLGKWTGTNKSGLKEEQKNSSAIQLLLDKPLRKAINEILGGTGFFATLSTTEEATIRPAEEIILGSRTATDKMGRLSVKELLEAQVGSFDLARDFIKCTRAVLWVHGTDLSIEPISKTDEYLENRIAEEVENLKKERK